MKLRGFLRPTEKKCTKCDFPKKEYFLGSSVCKECAGNVLKVNTLPVNVIVRKCLHCKKTKEEFFHGNHTDLCIDCFNNGIKDIEQIKLIDTTGSIPLIEEIQQDHKQEEENQIELSREIAKLREHRKSLGLTSHKCSLLMKKPEHWWQNRELGLIKKVPELSNMKALLVNYERNNKGKEPQMKKAIAKPWPKAEPENDVQNDLRKELKRVRESLGISQNLAAIGVAAYLGQDCTTNPSKWWWRRESSTSVRVLDPREQQELITALHVVGAMSEKEKNELLGKSTKVKKSPKGKPAKQPKIKTETPKIPKPIKKVAGIDSVGAVQGITVKVINGKLHVSSIGEVDDKKVIARLTKELEVIKHKLRALIGG